MVRKIICALSLLLCAALAVCSCSDGSTVYIGEGSTVATFANDDELDSPFVDDGGDSPLDPVRDITLAFRANDSLSPYAAISKANRELSTLLYESLTRIAPDFSPEMLLADNVEVSGSSVKITLRPSATFSDGSYVTADDVVYSYGLAKASAAYGGPLSRVTACYASNGYVYMELSEGDIFFASNLDFPVLKNGTSGNKDANGVPTPPVGSGRYIYSESDGEPRLIKNPSYNGPLSVTIDSIKLIDTPDSESLTRSIESGQLSVCFNDLSDITSARINGKTAFVNLNSMVFLGVNSKSGPLSDVRARQAVCQLIDRQEIAGECYFGNAIESTGPLNPAFFGKDDTPYADIYTADVNKAVAKLAELGYNSDNVMSLTVTVNSDNPCRLRAAENIAASLRQAGVDASVDALPYAEYSAAVTGGNYDLYLGETSVANDMNITSLLNPGFGLTQNISVFLFSYQKFKAFLAGSISYDDFAGVFNAELPFIPVVCRCGSFTYASYIDGECTATKDDLFYNIDQWY